MRIKLLTTLALLLMAVSGAWAKNYLYLEVTSTSTATLKYGDPGSDSGKPYYYDRDWHDNGYNGNWNDFKRNNCTVITVDMNDQSFENSKPTTLENLFKEFTALEAIYGLGNLNTSKVTNMEHMFHDCSSLTTLDLSGWDTSEVTNMSNMFNGCTALTTLDLTGWDTSKVTDMGQMFHTCSELTMLDLSGWDTSKVEDMYEMFFCCKKLLTLNLSGWDTSNVTAMGSIFASCEKLAILTLDPVKWSTANVTNMQWMFLGCMELTTLDLSEWNTSKVENMNYMFYYCEKLETIYVGDGWSTTNVTSSNSMFEYCTKLPNYNSSEVDKTHANTGVGGYLNAKAITKVTWDDTNVFKSDNASNYVDGSQSSQTFEGITISVSGSTSSFDPYDMEGKASLEVYGNSGDSFTFTAPTGKRFTKIEIVDKDDITFTPYDDWTLPVTTKIVWSGTAASTVTLGGSAYTCCYSLKSIVFTLEPISAISVNLTANNDGAGNYWATYYNSAQGYIVDANTTVYQAKVNSGKTAVVLTEVTSRQIPAGQGVVLKSSSGSIALSPVITSETFTANDLLGTDVALDNPGNAYCLSNETTGSARGVGFYSYTSTDGPNGDGVIPAHRAYLQIPSSARSFYGFGDDNYTTDIDLPKAVVIEDDGLIYDLSGRRVTGQPKKGIYVKNGKLFVIK